MRIIPIKDCRFVTPGPGTDPTRGPSPCQNREQSHRPGAARGRGKDMAVLMTGCAGQTSLTLVNDGPRYTQLDGANPGIKRSNFHSFEALGETGDTSSINLNFVDLAGPTKLSHLESLFTYDGNYGYSGRDISTNEQFEGVPASVKGMERLRSYAKTTEYGQIKAMMLSLERTKKAASGTPQADAGAGGQCAGAMYAYDLADSGMSCAEAKSFVQKLADSRPSAGSVEIMGHGACELPYPGNAGRCIVEDTGATFNYEMKQWPGSPWHRASHWAEGDRAASRPRCPGIPPAAEGSVNGTESDLGCPRRSPLA